jgi:hypothetical protein
VEGGDFYHITPRIIDSSEEDSTVELECMSLSSKERRQLLQHSSKFEERQYWHCGRYEEVTEMLPPQLSQLLRQSAVRVRGLLMLTRSLLVLHVWDPPSSASILLDHYSIRVYDLSDLLASRSPAAKPRFLWSSPRLRGIDDVTPLSPRLLMLNTYRGQKLLSQSSDAFTEIWDWLQNRQVASFRTGEHCMAGRLRFNSDGQHILALQPDDEHMYGRLLSVTQFV